MLPQSAPSTSPPDAEFVQGLGRNWRQFALLVVVNGFVGGMVGLERAVLPLLADREFGITANSAMLSFIVSFGVAKAITNLVAGRAAEGIGRKPLLVGGWIVALPIPILLWYAPNWNWVTAANVLLGVNQGLCWSTTVVMKIDIVGAHRRGLAMGLNEFAGYGAVALMAWGCALLASTYGFRMALFVSGMTMAACGLLLSLFVRDTTPFARSEARSQHGTARDIPTFRRVFVTTSVTDRNLAACSQAGLVNNLNDGVAWGLLPLLFASRGLGLEQVGVLSAMYPAVWSMSQIGTGALSDRWGRKWPIAVGMWVQAVGIFLIVAAADPPYAAWLTGSVLLGLGTALVYPSLLAAIGDRAEPGWRASAVGVYRLWRDLGYAVGAVLAGFLADKFGISPAIAIVGLLTLASGVIVAARMIEE